MKRRRYEKRKALVLFVAIFILFVGIGYSFFAESLNITGSATVPFYLFGDKLDVTLYQSGGRYTTGTEPGNATFVSETLTENELVLTYNRNNSGNSSSTSSHTITFSNKYPINLTNGSVSHQIVSGANISSLTSSVGKTSLIPEESTTLTINITRTNKSGQEVLATMQFTGSGVTQYFYFRLIFT